RYLVWVLAMAVLVTGPVVAVRSYAGTAFDATHIPERYGLFTLIVIGESIVAVSTGTAGAGWSLVTALAAAGGFGLAACLWWLYSDYVRSPALSREHLLPAFTWGYGQLFIFAGIAAAAAGVQLAIEGAAAGRALTGAESVILGGGLTAYLLAPALTPAVTVRHPDAVLAGRLAAAGVTAALALLGPALPPLLLLGLFLATFVGLTLYETALAGRSIHPA